MKTLAHPRDRAEILRRLSMVRPETAGRWGSMSAHQMVCHLSDSLRMASGDKAVSDSSSIAQRTVVKWVALYAPLRWPAGIPTRPEIDQRVGGTPPADFARDVAELEVLIERAIGDDGRGRSDSRRHPIFGRMSASAWLRLAYRHFDHHLRQFGV